MTSLLSVDCTVTTFATAVLGAITLLYFARRYFQGGVCRSTARLDGKTVIITGANSGIGKETAKDLSKRGARVILACRDVERGEKAAEEVKQHSGNSDVVVRKLDLASLQSVRDFAQQITQEEKRLDILINNAGVMWCPYTLTEDGFEMHFGVNYLGHFLLTTLLLDLLKLSAPSRIVNLSSIAYQFALKGIKFDEINAKKGYRRGYAYFQSKLANLLFTRELNRQLAGTSATVYAVHPGTVSTELGRHFDDTPWLWPIYYVAKTLIQPVLSLCLKTPRQGAQTSIYCAVTEGLEKDSGKYFSDCAVKNPSKRGTDDQAAKKLWQISKQMAGPITR